MGTFGLKNFLKLPKLLVLAIKAPGHDTRPPRDQLVGFAERARKEGLLRSEADVDKVDDPFVRRGLQMVIDGLEPETVEEVLELEIDAMKKRHALGANMFAVAAGYAPTFGILGAVMGLISAMAHLSEPEKLGPGDPGRLHRHPARRLHGERRPCPGLRHAQATLASTRVTIRNMVLTGILAIQAGDNPRIVAQKLASYLPPGTPEPGAKAAADAGGDAQKAAA